MALSDNFPLLTFFFGTPWYNLWRHESWFSGEIVWTIMKLKEHGEIVRWLVDYKGTDSATTTHHTPATATLITPTTVAKSTQHGYWQPCTLWSGWTNPIEKVYWSQGPCIWKRQRILSIDQEGNYSGLQMCCCQKKSRRETGNRGRVEGNPQTI